MRVLVIDDHPVVIQGCRQLLEGMEVREVLTASGLAEGFRLYRRKRPDMVVTDLSIHGRELAGLSFIRRVRLFDIRTPILVLTMHDDPVVAGRALEAGANGYLLKDMAAEELSAAFRHLREGRIYLSRALAPRVTVTDEEGGGSPLSAMTRRELQTLSRIAEGKPYGAIASELSISYKTVVNTCAQLKTKLGVRTLPELMRIAIRHLPAAADNAGTS
jgi:two-component system invasion response regulator UvrY